MRLDVVVDVWHISLLASSSIEKHMSWHKASHKYGSIYIYMRMRPCMAMHIEKGAQIPKKL